MSTKGGKVQGPIVPIVLSPIAALVGAVIFGFVAVIVGAIIEIIEKMRSGRDSS
jgi:hypothetical protein